MDIVYIVGTGSVWQNNELRYSLRSLEQHFRYNNVVIVGHKPDWVQNVIHIPMVDGYANVHGGKYKNVVKKTIAACEDERVSKHFVLMNDDFFFLQDCTEIKPYTTGLLQTLIEKYTKSNRNQYGNALLRTKRILKLHGIEKPLSYAVHYPIVYEKAKFLQMMNTIDWEANPASWRTLYGNLFQIGSIERKDPKVNNEEDLEEFLDIELDFLSTSDQVVLIPAFQNWIAERFPNKSHYETD